MLTMQAMTKYGVIEKARTSGDARRKCLRCAGTGVVRDPGDPPPTSCEHTGASVLCPDCEGVGSLPCGVLASGREVGPS